MSIKVALLAVVSIFLASVFGLYLVYLNFPKLSPDELEKLKLPRNIEDAKQLGFLLSQYTDNYYYTVLSGYVITYIFLQTFAIPGSIFLSVLSGFLFNFWIALLLVCTCSAVGASLCYLLSYSFGRPLIQKYFQERVEQWSKQVEKHNANLTFYIIFLRITPFLPNWFINIASPIINVHLGCFFIGTFIGVAAPSFVAIEAGKTLNKLTSTNDFFSLNSLLLLCLFACLSLLPVLFRAKLRNMF